MPSTKPGDIRKFGPDTRITVALQVLEALTAAVNNRLDAGGLMASLGLNERQLDEIVTTIDTLGDRTTGMRAIVYREGDDIVLQGRSTQVAPIRLARDELLMMGTLLSDASLSPDTRQRLARSFLGSDPDEDESILLDTARAGAFYRILCETIEDGVRIQLTYRSTADEAPKKRLVDPYAIETEDEALYLIAWDIQRDAQRRYRLDRICAVDLTEDSVVFHPFRNESITDSLRRHADQAVLHVPDATYLAQLGWAGAGRSKRDVQGGGLFVEVSYASKAWLFDQILAAGGDMQLAEPRELAEEFAAYAHKLLEKG